MTVISIDRLDPSALAKAGVVWITGADELLRASALRAVELMAPHPFRSRRLVADEVAALTGGGLDTLSPNGLFGADAVIIVDRIAASHRAKLPEWCERLAALGRKPSLILCGVAIKPAPAWPADSQIDFLTIDADIAATPFGALNALVGNAFPDASADLFRPAARRLPTLTLERALQMLALEDRPANEAAEALRSAESATTGPVRAALDGDLPALAHALGDELRAASELSAALAQIAWPLRRALGGDRLVTALVDIHRAERAQREQAPLAHQRGERALLRLARRSSGR